MIYVTGDMHGELEVFSERKLGQIKKNDTLIVTGDFGFLWNDSKEEQKNLKKLGKKKYNILFVEGAHENLELIKQHEEVDFCGGKAYRIADNIYCLKRGDIYTVESRRIFALGGGLPPFEDQGEENPPSMPDDDELNRAVENLQAHHREVDIIITHEAPASVKKLIDRRAAINDLNIFLDTVLHNTRYGRWFFGSLHQDRAISENLICVFEDVYGIK